jgi:hypothetical protein
LTFAKGGCAEIGAKLINPSQDFDWGISLGKWGARRARPHIHVVIHRFWASVWGDWKICRQPRSEDNLSLTYLFSMRMTRSQLMSVTKVGTPNRLRSSIPFHGGVLSKKICGSHQRVCLSNSSHTFLVVWETNTVVSVF